MTTRHGSLTRRRPGTGTAPSAAEHRSGVVAQLDREWRRLRRDRAALTAARSWAVVPPLGAVLDDLADLQALVDVTQRGACPDSDRILLQLVTVSRLDPLAARVVLQRILPGLLAASARHRSFNEHVDVADVVLAAAWEAIRRYDSDRRRRHVAASLISDAVYTAFRRPRRRRSAGEEVRDSSSWDDDALVVTRCSFEELAHVVREARRCGVDDDHLRLIGDLVRTGSTTRVAAEHGVTDRTIRNRRERAVASVRQAVLMDAA